MSYNLGPPPISPWHIALSLIGFVLLLMLASCATPPRQVVAVPCQEFPPVPSLTLPETGHFHRTLTSILQNVSTPKSLTPPITP